MRNQALNNSVQVTRPHPGLVQGGSPVKGHSELLHTGVLGQGSLRAVSEFAVDLTIDM